MRTNISKEAYIKAAYEILISEGPDSLSIRKLAQKLDCNSANLYRYFSNLDELYIYASLKYLDEYIHEVTAIFHSGMPILKQHLEVWRTFSKYCFANPQIYNNLFFGKYSKKLTDVIAEYYSMFPDESTKMHMEYIPVFFEEGDFRKRDYMMLEKCIKEGIFTETDAVLINKMSIYLCQGCVKEILDHPDTDPEIISADFLECLSSILTNYARKNSGDLAT